VSPVGRFLQTTEGIGVSCRPVPTNLQKEVCVVFSRKGFHILCLLVVTFMLFIHYGLRMLKKEKIALY
jgi:hypothetical protein